MAPIDPKDNIRFLIVCIGNSTNGKPNFDAVAKELDIVSKGAASKRYERLLKSHGFLPGAVGKSTAADDDEDGEEFEAKPTPKKRKAPATPKTPTPKKVKPATPRGKKAPVKKEEDDEDEADVKAESESSLSDPPEDLKEENKEGEI